VKKIITSCVLLGIAAIAVGIEKQTATMPIADDTIKLKTLEIDGFRYIKKVRNDAKVNAFWNNGVYGEGLMLSLFGELDSNILDIRNVKTEKVVLEDGTQLTHEQIREHGFPITLGRDKKSFAFHVDLDIKRMTNIKHLSGEFEIVRAAGEANEVTSGLLEDSPKSKENKIEISVEVAQPWMGGRYYVLLIDNAENILELTVLDEKGNELKQTDPFSIFGEKHDRVKVYVKKKTGDSFAIKLKRASKLQVERIPFALENINLMTY
jgi:hypothetical protein